MANSLILRFGTDLEPAKRGLAAFAASTGTQLAGVAAASIGAGRALMATGAAAGNAASSLDGALRIFALYKGALGLATLALAAFSAASEEAAEQVKKLQDIAAGAKAAGVSSDIFQAWRAGAAALGLEVKDLDAALTHLRKAGRPGVDESGARTASEIEKIMQAQVDYKGIGARNLVRAQSGDEQEHLRAVLDQIRELHAEAMRLNDPQLWTWAQKLAEAAFGEKGRELAQAIADGRLSQEELNRKIADGGQIMNSGLVAESQALDARLREANERMESGMKPIMEDLARLGLAIKEGWVGIREMIASAAATLGSFYNTMKAAVALLPALEQPGARLDLSRAPNEGEQWAQAGRWLKSKFSGEKDVPFLAPLKPDPLGGATLDMDRENAMWAAQKAKREKDIDWKAIGAAQLRIDENSFEKPRGGARGSSASETDQVETYLSQLKKTVSALEAEAQAFGKSNVEKAKAVDLAKAKAAADERGTPLTESETQQVLRLAEAQGRLKDRLEEMKRAQEQSREQTRFFGDTLFNALDRAMQPGAKFADIMQGVVRSLEQAALKALILGEGPLAGLFGLGGQNGAAGGLFGMFAKMVPQIGMQGFGAFNANAGLTAGPSGFFPTFADGGVVPGAPGSAVPVIAHAGEVILNRAQQANVASGFGAGASIAIHNHAGARIEAQQTRGSNGRAQIAVMIHEAIVRDIATNGGVAKTLQGQYGLSRTGAR